MRRENARVGKGGSGVARKRRRRRIDASTPGPRERSGLSLPVVVEVPVGVERECEYVRLCVTVCFCISSGPHGRAGGIYKDVERQESAIRATTTTRTTWTRTTRYQRLGCRCRLGRVSRRKATREGEREHQEAATRGTSGAAGARDQDATEEVRVTSVERGRG
ncbi:hypothetical protein EAG_12190 [Camponotus floridanus]|uniref:Uncharacterized protein n=1 Tax=Camponotus floridanus TaxID=104421 RepID=E2AZZ2_CAMFO|nr:hypothetical protein EAG_12190 [Camponotus floridanus]